MGDNMSSSKRADISSKVAAWWQVSTLSDPLHATAVLYKSFKERDQCGHTVVVNHHSSLLGVAACPICDMPVAYIADGVVAKRDGGGPSVYFRYGKMVYRLSVQARKNQGQHKPWWMFWKDDSTVTAQQRIMSVLGISHGMKILHKGKVLYPLSSYTASNKNEKELELSEKLIELSSDNPATAPSLLVVGTPSQTQHEWLEDEQKQLRHRLSAANSNKDVWTVLTTLTIADVLLFGWWVATASLHWSAHFTVHCFAMVRDHLLRWFGLLSASHSCTD